MLFDASCAASTLSFTIGMANWHTSGATLADLKHSANKVCLATAPCKYRLLTNPSLLHSVLVANNGMAAVKFIRSIQDWAYKTFGNEHAIALVAMATPEDMRVDAEHIKMADQFVEVPGGSNANNYANVRLIVQTAEKANVDAVWPGW